MLNLIVKLLFLFLRNNNFNMINIEYYKINIFKTDALYNKEKMQVTK